MPHRKIPKDAFPVYLSAEEVNALLSMLDRFCEAEVDPENFIRKAAHLLRDKILKHGRTFQANGERSVSVYFFPSEIIPLLKILIIFISITLHPGTVTDYYPAIGRRHAAPNDGEGSE